MNTTSSTETASAETDENTELPCYCFVVGKPTDTKDCKMTSRCGNASDAVSDLIDTHRTK
ncbi:hypothetical protein V5T82_11060 [Magnetovibrio sp. PR-2]|uniref:hypothetical protein n=1 Tax=Magnetovibrio sp. PR-2 TaxID=3120356 RepID=UPI002FCE383B